MAAVSQDITYDSACRAAGAERLSVMGGLHDAGGTLLLLGPGPGFWEHLQGAPEMRDGAGHPIDRWSRRVISGLARDLGAQPLFPFGGPPYQPFLRWALASGRAWQSPLGMLVHDEAGLMVSYRGALRFDARLGLPPPPAASPCEDCTGRPCAAACPAGALSDAHAYDVAACHAWLDSPAGQDCMSAGCIARRACPVSRKFDRDPAQSALHMSYFHPS